MLCVVCRVRSFSRSCPRLTMKRARTMQPHELEAYLDSYDAAGPSAEDSARDVVAKAREVLAEYIPQTQFLATNARILCRLATASLAHTRHQAAAEQRAQQPPRATNKQTARSAQSSCGLGRQRSCLRCLKRPSTQKTARTWSCTTCASSVCTHHTEQTPWGACRKHHQRKRSKLAQTTAPKDWEVIAEDDTQVKQTIAAVKWYRCVKRCWLPALVCFLFFHLSDQAQNNKHQTTGERQKMFVKGTKNDQSSAAAPISNVPLLFCTIAALSLPQLQ